MIEGVLMKSNTEQLKSRGYIEEQDLESFRGYTKQELIELIKSKVSVDRTIAATLLGTYSTGNSEKTSKVEILTVLVEALKTEKKLYSKIAMSESIALYGEEASVLLVKALGRIGKNQHKKLPDKPFNKSSYPLPRDIAARTICKIGTPALKDLGLCLREGAYTQILEAIDAVGFISYYHKNSDCFDDIGLLFDKYRDDQLMLWKLLRSLQAFPNDDAIKILKHYINSDVKQLQWEAERSMRLLSLNE